MNNQFCDKKILVLGMAKSGFETAKLLHQLGADVIVNDGKDLDEDQHAGELRSLGIKIVDKGHPLTLLDGVDIIFKNPGIPYSVPILMEAKNRNIKILTEVELAYLVHPGQTISITGTNGKTTVTSLIGEMFKHSSKKGVLAGNIGFVASKVAQETTEDETMITELSSFQLMGIEHYRPHIAVITNIYSAHLDYHASQEEYVQAKLDITKNQTAEDYLVFNAAQKELLNTTHINSSIVYFSPVQKTNGAYIDGDTIYFKDEALMPVSEVVLQGKHNIENVLAAITACKLAGIENGAIIKTLQTFEGIKHRTQFVRLLDGVKYYNDSKATNTLAAKFALAAFDAPIHWLAGGLDRGNGFSDLDDWVTNVKHMYIFGQTTDKLAEFANKHHIPYEVCETIEDAVEKTKNYVMPGDIVLLSPACASWDQYPNFEIRGDRFIDKVQEL